MIRAVNGAVLTLVILFPVGVAAEAASVRFLAVGDILPDRGIRRLTERHGFDYPFAKAAPHLQGADLSFGNLEGCLDTTGVPLVKKYVFRGDPEFADGLSRAGFDVLALANNHSLDGGRESLVKTMDLLAGHSLLSVGAGKNQAEARAPVIVEKNGLRFAFLAFGRFLPEGLAYLADKPSSAYASEEEILSEIGKVRGKVDFVIVSLHWGVEYETFPTLHQEELAHRAVESGADLIIGHHPHVLQGVEFYRGRPILYSLGNFVFDNPALEQRQTAAFGCEFEKGRIARPFLVPFLSQDLQPRPAGGDDLEGILKRVKKASERFGVSARSDGERIHLAESKGRDVFEFPLATFAAGKRSVEVCPRQVALVEKGRTLSLFSLSAENEIILSAEMIVEGKAAHIYPILGRPGAQRGDRLAVLSIDLKTGRFGPLIRDPHNGFNPWKLMKCDVDGDGVIELAAGVYKTTRYDKQFDNRLFIFDRQGEAFYPRWLGSRLGLPFLDFAFRDLDGDGADEVLVIEEAPGGTRRLAGYRWRKFGFEEWKIIEDPTERKDFKEGAEGFSL